MIKNEIISEINIKVNYSKERIINSFENTKKEIKINILIYKIIYFIKINYFINDKK